MCAIKNSFPELTIFSICISTHVVNGERKKNYPNHKNSMKLQTEFKDVHCSKVILTIFPGRKWCLSYLVTIFHSDIDLLHRQTWNFAQTMVVLQ